MWWKPLHGPWFFYYFRLQITARFWFWIYISKVNTGNQVVNEISSIYVMLIGWSDDICFRSINPTRNKN